MSPKSTSRKVPGSTPDVAGDFSVASDSSMCPGVDSDSASKNEHRDTPEGKGGRCVRLTTYHLHVPIVKKSGGLNLLEPCGPVQACNGPAVPLHTVYTVCAINLLEKNQWNEAYFKIIKRFIIHTSNPSHCYIYYYTAHVCVGTLTHSITIMRMRVPTHTYTHTLTQSLTQIIFHRRK